MLSQHNLAWWNKNLLTGLLSACHLLGMILPATAQTTTTNPAAENDYCFLPEAAVREKNKWRSAAIQGQPGAKQRYIQTIQRHAQNLQRCRQQSWLKTQALWLRMYPCDTRPGAVDELLDYAVDRGYNQIYLATFYAGQVLLPEGDNPTVWPSVLDTRSVRNRDLLAEVIKKGRERGLKVYAWMYSLSFGPNYLLNPNRATALNVNGRGESSLFAGDEGVQPPTNGSASLLFVNPYSAQAQADFGRLVGAVAQRRPDGILFDYIRYPRGQGAQSVISGVQDLWIYGDDALKQVETIAQNQKGTELMKIFLEYGDIRPTDVAAVDKKYTGEQEPLWQGRKPVTKELKLPDSGRAAIYQKELWQLVVDRAAYGVVQYLTQAAAIAQQAGVPAGAVFFPEANQTVGQQGYDSRLQTWDRFPANLEWHPMVYATCGQSQCIEDQVRQVLKTASPQTNVIPALAGVWGRSFENRPSLEIQLAGIRRSAPEINAISHFSYSWQEPSSDSFRRTCRLRN